MEKERLEKERLEKERLEKVDLTTGHGQKEGHTLGLGVCGQRKETLPYLQTLPLNVLFGHSL